MEEFKKELENLINKHSIENLCDMPDFILAEMMIGIIQVAGKAAKKNLDWHGCDSVCHPTKRKEDISGALARGYCTKRNEKKVLDPDLIEDMAFEVGKLNASSKGLDGLKDIVKSLDEKILELDKLY